MKEPPKDLPTKANITSMIQAKVSLQMDNDNFRHSWKILNLFVMTTDHINQVKL